MSSLITFGTDSLIPRKKGIIEGKANVVSQTIPVTFTDIAVNKSIDVVVEIDNPEYVVSIEGSTGVSTTAEVTHKCPIVWVTVESANDAVPSGSYTVKISVLPNPENPPAYNTTPAQEKTKLYDIRDPAGTTVDPTTKVVSYSGVDASKKIAVHDNKEYYIAPDDVNLLSNVLTEEDKDGNDIVEAAIIITTKVTSFKRLFYNNKKSYEVNNWDTAAVTDLTECFFGSNHKGSLEHWNTSAVTKADSTFENCTTFTGTGVEAWDTSAVTTTRSMFEGAIAFNGDVSEWDMGANLDMTSMFYRATSFSRNLRCWNVSNIPVEPSLFAQTLKKWEMPIWGNDGINATILITGDTATITFCGKDPDADSVTVAKFSPQDRVSNLKVKEGDPRVYTMDFSRDAGDSDPNASSEILLTASGITYDSGAGTYPHAEAFESASDETPPSKGMSTWCMILIILSIVVGVILVAIGIWYFVRRSGSKTSTFDSTADVDRNIRSNATIAAPYPPLPDQKTSTSPYPPLPDQKIRPEQTQLPPSPPPSPRASQNPLPPSPRT